MDKYVITRIKNVLTGFYFEDGRLADICCYEDDSLIGNIYIGKVVNIVRNINAAFVNISSNISCYLSLEDYRGEKPLRIGDELPVQVVSDKIKTKQMTVTADISFANEYAVVSTDGVIGASNKLPNDTKKELKEAIKDVVGEFSLQSMRRDIKYGAIARTKAGEVSALKLREKTLFLLKKLDELMSRIEYNKCYSLVYKNEAPYIEDIRGYLKKGAEVITDVEGIYEECRADMNGVTFYADEQLSLIDMYRLMHYIEQALSKRAYMNSGAYLVIEPTEALTVIDVNSGKAIKGKNSEEVVLKINLEAAREALRQIRLRNITGIVIVDFISMKNNKSNEVLLAELEKQALKDSVKVNIVDMTPLGLVEITRQKSKKSLDMIFSR